MDLSVNFFQKLLPSLTFFRALKIKYGAITLPAVLCGCETSLALGQGWQTFSD
jgi:hypothetical protein